FMPNLVQTLENTPAIIHGGPFANIAHGCSSLIATRLGLKLADYLVTEAGFGADLGAEKFMNLKSRLLGRGPDAVVVVASVRALKMHGGQPRNSLGQADIAALGRGLANLEKHLENIAAFGVPVVVALNRFPTDTTAELELVQARCAELGVRCALATVWADGGAGGAELAEAVVAACHSPSSFRHLYELDQPVEAKIEAIATRIYGAEGVDYTPAARKALQDIDRLGYSGLPVCVAKTQYSLSDDPTLLGRPRGFRVTVRDVRLSAGAGFIVPLMGNILTMPGLSRHPAAFAIDMDASGRIVGLF
ncbi:MAG: formate--tetrahydrofolate ligase, partial [Syntrophomonadaceae bacterium]|nr:formate--tetrahydrofolate ligase [Syntrophomonadaceae bacterium]